MLNSLYQACFIGRKTWCRDKINYFYCWHLILWDSDQVDRKQSQDIAAHWLQNEMQPAKWLIFTNTSKAFDMNTGLILWVTVNLEIKPKTLLWKLQNSLVRCPSRWRACCTSLRPWFRIPGTTEKAKPSNHSLWSQHWEAETGGSEGLAQVASPAESASSRFMKRPCLK